MCIYCSVCIIWLINCADSEDVSCLSWNSSVSHILATGTGAGQTVVWDLRQRKHAIRYIYMYIYEWIYSFVFMYLYSFACAIYSAWMRFSAQLNMNVVAFLSGSCQYMYIYTYMPPPMHIYSYVYLHLLFMCLNLVSATRNTGILAQALYCGCLINPHSFC